MKELIKTLLGDMVRKIAPNFRGEILVEIPENKEFGDYTSNIAFSLSKILGKSPQQIAEDLVKKLSSQKIKDFARIETKNGFVNFFLSEECLQHQLKEILSQSRHPMSKFLRHWMSEKINIEFISANPTGPLTIGNGRGGFYGDVLANILETQGNKVVREYYINDRGGQVLALGRSIKLAQGASLLIPRIEESAEGGGRILRINSYSTVTLLAKFLGLSTSNPLKTPM